jgi:polysaccharide biosynthesis/export protein
VRFMTRITKLSLISGALLASVQAIAQEPGKPSLRLSDELTLSSVAVRVPAAALQRAALLPAAPQGAAPYSQRDYRIGPEDLLEIQVFGVDQLTRTVRVNARGMISLPLVGNLELGGLTAQQAEALIVARLAESFLQDPQVSLFIKEYTSQRVTIEGAVNKPGVYPLRGPTTLLQSLAVAGGQANLSDMTEVMLFRADTAGRRETLVYDVDRIRSGQLEDPAVVNDDLIVVKRSKARTILKDSIVRDILETVNPFRWTP